MKVCQTCSRLASASIVSLSLLYDSSYVAAISRKFSTTFFKASHLILGANNSLFPNKSKPAFPNNPSLLLASASKCIRFSLLAGRQSFCHSASKLIRQSVSQSVSQSGSPSVGQSVIQSVSSFVSQSAGQPASKFIS